jgi:hypothetical protein
MRSGAFPLRSSWARICTCSRRRYEGLIPEGQYGAGPVIVWDTGSYRSLTEEDDGKTVPVEQAVQDGHVAVWLEGRKRGGRRGGRSRRGQPGGALRPVQRILHDQNLAPGVATDPVRVGRASYNAAPERGGVP